MSQRSAAAGQRQRHFDDEFLADLEERADHIRAQVRAWRAKPCSCEFPGDREDNCCSQCWAVWR